MKRLLRWLLLLLVFSCAHAWAHPEISPEDAATQLSSNFQDPIDSQVTLIDPNSPKSVDIDGHSPSSPSHAKTGATRSFTENNNVIISYEVAPLKLTVYTPILSVVGSVDIGSRDSVQISFQVDPIKPLKDTDHIWDPKGRGLLVAGDLTCKIIYTTTLIDDRQAGMTLGAAGSFNGMSGMIGASPSWEKFSGVSPSETKTCAEGEVPSYTTAAQLQQKCLSCYQQVKKTLSDDTHARANALGYLVNTNLCKKDSECTQEDSPWSVGRCTLVKDRRDWNYTECRSLSRIGGPCPGHGSSRMFEYPCDKGLKCVLVHKGTGLTWQGHDFNRYECRDPKHPQWTHSPDID